MIKINLNIYYEFLDDAHLLAALGARILAPVNTPHLSVCVQLLPVDITARTSHLPSHSRPYTQAKNLRQSLAPTPYPQQLSKGKEHSVLAIDRAGHATFPPFASPTTHKDSSPTFHSHFSNLSPPPSFSLDIRDLVPFLVPLHLFTPGDFVSLGPLVHTSIVCCLSVFQAARHLSSRLLSPIPSPAFQIPSGRSLLALDAHLRVSRGHRGHRAFGSLQCPSRGLRVSIPTPSHSNFVLI